ncbi:DUF484 family protein, partial [Klebsiella pneumoniae]
MSLVEWHMMQARLHIHALEENMSLPMEQAVATESLFQPLLQRHTRLAAAERLDATPTAMHRWATELGLGAARATLFLFWVRLGSPL